MGYIFDALNKQREGQADAQTSEEQAVNEVTGPVPRPGEQAADQTQADAPLRFEDAPAVQAADGSQPPTFIADAIDTQEADEVASEATGPLQIDPELNFNIDEAGQPDATTSELNSTPLQIGTGAPSPRSSWWARLTGKHLRGKVDDRLVAMTMPASAMSEEYRSIRTSILARHDNERHLVHTISSATPQEGKTITCVNLGLTFAELRNRSTIIIECDLRLPTFGKLLSCDANKPGLIDYLRGDVSLKDVVQKVEGSALHIIPAGGRVSDEAVQLLSSGRMTRLIQALRTKYDHVLIDTPPVLQLADAGILGSQSEEVLLVARMRRTPRPLVEQAVNTLTSYNAVVSGIIATDNPRSRRGYGYKYGYGYRYGYGYGYGYTDDKRKKRRKRDAA